MFSILAREVKDADQMGAKLMTPNPMPSQIEAVLSHYLPDQPLQWVKRVMTEESECCLLAQIPHAASSSACNIQESSESVSGKCTFITPLIAQHMPLFPCLLYPQQTRGYAMDDELHLIRSSTLSLHRDAWYTPIHTNH